MKTILLVSHGQLARGMEEAISMIAGQHIQFKSVCLEADMGIETFEVLLSDRIDSISDHHFFVITDLKGGSPHTKTLEVLQRKAMLERVTVISGMNLALVLALSFVSIDDNQGVEKAIEEARSNIGLLETFSDEDETL